MGWKISSDKQAQEIDMNYVLEDGVYSFRVSECKSSVSKAGNNMKVLTLDVLCSGKNVKSIDYIADTAAASMYYKRKHFWESVGRADLINTENDRDFSGMSGEAKFKAVNYENKEGEKRTKLEVVDYIPRDKPQDFAPASTKVSQEVDDFSDDLPF
jgi:hypothetical protein